MYDASAKLPSGILNGNIDQFGDFDQCLSGKSKVAHVNGQYCLANIQIFTPKDDEFLRFLRKQMLALEPYRNDFHDVSVNDNVKLSNSIIS